MTDAELLDRVRRFATLHDDDRVYGGEFMRGFTVGDASCRKQLRELLGIEE